MSKIDVEALPSPLPWEIHSTGSHLGIKDAEGKFVIRKVVSRLASQEFFRLKANFELMVLAANQKSNFNLGIDLFAASSLLPMRISGDNPSVTVEAIICDSISGGAAEKNNMPRELGLVSRLDDGTEHRARYVQRNR
jgi:hypothetical protein